MKLCRGCAGWRWVVGMMAAVSICDPVLADSRSLAEIKAGKRVSEAAAAVEAAPTAGETNAVPDGGRPDKVPAGWLRGSGPSGYERAMELQASSGRDMLVLFYREVPKDEKGLLRWFEKKGLNDARVQKQLRQYVKVRIDAGQHDPRTGDLVESYKVGKTPRLVVRRPDGFTRRVDVFDWPGGQPQLVEPNALVTSLKDASSPPPSEDVPEP